MGYSMNIYKALQRLILKQVSIMTLSMKKNKLIIAYPLTVTSKARGVTAHPLSGVLRRQEIAKYRTDFVVLIKDPKDGPNNSYRIMQFI